MAEKKGSLTIDWHSTEGRARLFESRYNRAFFNLAHFFQPQVKPTFCGIATTVIFLNAFRCGKGLVLNKALNVSKPDTFGGGKMEYNAYSQLTFFNKLTDKVKCRQRVEGKAGHKAAVFDPGVSLANFIVYMRLHHLDVALVTADVLSAEKIERFRQDLRSFLNDSSSFMAVNFYGRDLGKEVGGHFAPVVAYHEASDSCLVMDVAGHKTPWFWVGVEALYRAMHTRDGEHYRGYVVVADALSSN